MRDVTGAEMAAPLSETIIVNDPSAMRHAALLGLGVTMVAIPDVAADLEDGSLIRLIPSWYADAGAISVYYASRTLVPGKTRVFVDWVAQAFKRQRMAERFAGSLGRRAASLQNGKASPAGRRSQRRTASTKKSSMPMSLPCASQQLESPPS